MSREGVQAVRLAVGEVSEVLRTLTPEEWERPSGCEGWRVQDLVAHMSSNYKEIVDPSPPPSEPINLPAALDGPITLRLTGPGGGDYRIANEDAKIVITPGGAAGVANVSSDGHAFVIWGTKRAPWRDHCTVSGDGAVAAKFFDVLNIV